MKVWLVSEKSTRKYTDPKIYWLILNLEEIYKKLYTNVFIYKSPCIRKFKKLR